MRVAEAAAAAVGVRDGPTYTQVLVGPDGPRVGELAARLGGGHDAELCDAAVGVDLNRLAIAAALGERIYEGGLVPDELAGGACVRFLVPEPGVLEAVEGLDGGGAVERRRLGHGATASPATSSATSVAAPTAPAPCSPSATRAGRPSTARAARLRASASSPPKRERSSSVSAGVPRR